ncbi:hypothetical protein CRG98_009469 [Punica granatum]|uniref:RNase H type-1 domain-containing protein n=1 Tax=Punica granatum TaxID=22663 RepID=A0A2I0KNR0_PUNGR|nr:hypothetical protein CRG98_009469 [Punica granatum]
MHVLRDCYAAKMIWKQLVSRNLQHVFFPDDDEQWMIRNLSSSQSGPDGLSWALVFGVGRWLIWKRQNKSIFDPHFVYPIAAELLAVKVGLDMAWNLGTRKLILEVDSEAVHCMLRSNRDHEGWNKALVKDIPSLTERRWTVIVEHVYREGNKCAD